MLGISVDCGEPNRLGAVCADGGGRGATLSAAPRGARRSDFGSDRARGGMEEFRAEEERDKRRTAKVVELMFRRVDGLCKNATRVVMDRAHSQEWLCYWRDLRR